jgi:hypothetical protein
MVHTTIQSGTIYFRERPMTVGTMQGIRKSR